MKPMTFLFLFIYFFFFSAAPDPPSNFIVTPRNGKTAIVSWSPPAHGNYTGFRLRVQGFGIVDSAPRPGIIPADVTTYTLRDLVPGATYSLQLFTVLDGNESVAYTSNNVTTGKHKPTSMWRLSYYLNIYSSISLIPLQIQTHRGSLSYGSGTRRLFWFSGSHRIRQGFIHTIRSASNLQTR